MTIAERVAGLEFLRDGRGGDPGYPKTIREAHNYVGQLMDRPTWLHELADIDVLIAEVKCGIPAGFDDIVEKIPAEKRIVFILDQENMADDIPQA